MKKTNLLAWSLAQLLVIPATFAAGLVTQDRSEGEVCRIPNAFPGLNIFEPTSKESALCGYDFYSDPSVAICAKGNSTNPGVLVFELNPGVSQSSFETDQCLKVNPVGGKKVGKFKSSITCSYTPSILGYYQLSRYLNGAGNVPAAVYRTMNETEHKKITAEGEQTAIKASWAQFASDELNPAAHPSIFLPVGGGQYDVYGALSENPKDEAFYGDFYGPKHTYDQGLTAFQQTVPFQHLINANPVAATLMNQQDRFGNVAYVNYYQYVENGQVVSEKLQTGDKAPAQLADMKQKGGVLVKVSLMKDNDCGVDKTNLMKGARLIEKVRHIHPETYAAIQRLAHTLATQGPVLENYFKTELLYSDLDWEGTNGFSKNLVYVANTLLANCKAGSLKLDLDVNAYLGLTPAQSNCEIQ